jgi:hypothetical protein
MITVLSKIHVQTVASIQGVTKTNIGSLFQIKVLVIKSPPLIRNIIFNTLHTMKKQLSTPTRALKEMS